MLKRGCISCGLETLPHEEKCIRCGGNEFSEFEVYPTRAATDEDVQQYLVETFGKSNALARSDQVCVCGGRHYMVYPAYRNGDKEPVQKLTNVPFCPRRVWEHSDIKIGINELLDKLRTEA